MGTWPRTADPGQASDAALNDARGNLLPRIALHQLHGAFRSLRELRVWQRLESWAREQIPLKQLDALVG